MTLISFIVVPKVHTHYYLTIYCQKTHISTKRSVRTIQLLADGVSCSIGTAISIIAIVFCHFYSNVLDHLSGLLLNTSHTFFFLQELRITKRAFNLKIIKRLNNLNRTKDCTVGNDRRILNSINYVNLMSHTLR